MKNCKQCGREKSPKRKYCSAKCYFKSKVGEKHWWGYKIGNALRSVPKSPEHIQKVSDALTGKKRPDIAGKNCRWWKGEAVGYDGLHDWIRKEKGVPKKCSSCGIVGI